MLGVAAGAVLATYYLDPQQGRTRRALVRDQIYGRLSRLDKAARVVAIDARNRLLGVFGDLRMRMTGRHVPDEVLAERVRAKLGRVVSHPGAIEVSASDGVVTLSGPVLAWERRPLLLAVHGVARVRGMVDRLEPHERAGDTPGLQGGTRRGQRIAAKPYA
jgi:hypothetical protein